MQGHPDRSDILSVWFLFQECRAGSSSARSRRPSSPSRESSPRTASESGVSPRKRSPCQPISQSVRRPKSKPMPFSRFDRQLFFFHSSWHACANGAQGGLHEDPAKVRHLRDDAADRGLPRGNGRLPELQEPHQVKDDKDCHVADKWPLSLYFWRSEEDSISSQSLRTCTKKSKLNLWFIPYWHVSNEVIKWLIFLSKWSSA